MTKATVIRVSISSNAVRILDFVGFIVDTPALNAVLDVLGHTANSFCHICRTIQGNSLVVGSRYTKTDRHGFRSAIGRTYFQHCAVRDCGAQPETCRLLGMKPSHTEASLPLHSLRTATINTRGRIPTAKNGIPILAGELDPYRACLVAPDHLLTGHARDCINLAFKLLPSKHYAALCEDAMMGLLVECGLPAQNRLLDNAKRCLYTMSMTEMYTLILVAELGFIKGSKHVSSEGGSISSISSKCLAAISLVRSISRVISALWRLPVAERDGSRAVASFEKDKGQCNIRQIQHLIIQHVVDVQSQCTMTDADVNAMEDPLCDRTRRATLLKEHKACLVALRTVDKPNVHRLQELVSTTLPMVGHVSRIGELELEKAHQALKTAIKNSNNKEVQISSMKTIAMSDWQGRLAMVVPDALRRDTDALRCCFRILAGRGSMFKLGGSLNAQHVSEVLRALSPGCCVPQELKYQAAAVLSTRSIARQRFSWKLEGSIQCASLHAPLSTLERRDALDCIQNAYRFDENECTVEMGDSVSSMLPSQVHGLGGATL